MGITSLKQRIAMSLAGLTGLGMAASILVAAPAFAAFDDPSCYAPQYTTCTTRAIPAHSTQHWIRVRVWSGAIYTVTDLDTGAIVARGSGDGNWHTTYGLYGQRYQLWVSALFEGAQGTIANCTTGCVNN